MEPRFFKRGNTNVTPVSLLTRPASMEPRFFKRGNEDAEEFYSDMYYASMEPRFFKRGNQRRNYVQIWACTCFNGTTFFQTWKCGHVRTRIGRALPRFNGTTFFQTWKCAEVLSLLRAKEGLQWNHVFSNVEIRRSNVDSDFRVAGFNGTTFFQTWK